jgi:hypothetical protein
MNVEGEKREEKNDAFSRSTSDGRLGPTSNAQRYAAGCVFFFILRGGSYAARRRTQEMR